MNYESAPGAMPKEIHQDNMHLTVINRSMLPKDQAYTLEKQKIAASLFCIFQKYQSHDL